MRLSKNGEFVELENEIHVAAYKARGWVEVREVEKVEEKPKRVRKAKTE